MIRTLPKLLTAPGTIIPMVLLLAGSVSADEQTEILFVRRIQPLLSARCLACHGQDENKIGGNLDLRSPEGVLKGGDSREPAFIPGDPRKSPLWLAVTRDSTEWSAMPPKQADKLTPEESNWLKDWISGGAVWPNATRIAEIRKLYSSRWAAEDGVAVTTSGGLTDEWNARRYQPAGLWAYRPVHRPAVDVKGTAAVDALIGQRIPAWMSIAPPAPARTFIRRASFDLTGLPPTPEQIGKFEVDYGRDPDAAVAALVDSLLESPHYGERMAQHWLDVVRYADSSGFANDYERGNAWRYRDYVVRSFNKDTPYDRFIREQIAGDEIDPGDPELLVATGFLRMGPWELTGMEVAKIARQRFLDDVTNSVGETFLAHSLQCARCHDHKFDPVPTRDYYAIQAAFATTQLVERDAAFLAEENTAGFEERKYLEVRAAEHQATLADLDTQLLKNATKWIEDNGKDADQWNVAVTKARQSVGPRTRPFSDVFVRARNLLQQQQIPEADYPPKLVGFTAEQFGRERVARKGLERLKWELDRYEPVALAVYTGRTRDVKAVLAPQRMTDKPDDGEVEQTCILTGGDPFSSGEPVRPGVLSAVPLAPPEFESGLAGRRRKLADWIAHPENPLTTRCIVNRVWMWHFGEPLAGNPNNFGSTGKRPTHPELLDWLAAELVAHRWSLKALHRTIMNSAAYRRSTGTGDSPVDHEASSERWNALAAFRPRRLSAEELRDSMLAVTGELNRILGGIPNRPELNLEVALQPRQVMGTFAAAWVPNPQPHQRHRRTIYALKLRGMVDPALEVFNAPSPDFSCERRDSSAVSPQVFALFNSQTSHGRALALANRVLKECGNTGSGNDREVISRLYWLVFGRPSSAEEIKLCVDHWGEMTRSHAAAAEQVRFSEQPRTVRREAVEENTGEKFAFNESLHGNEEFVADPQPGDFDARTRGLASLCLVLLNASEFSYVY